PNAWTSPIEVNRHLFSERWDKRMAAGKKIWAKGRIFLNGIDVNPVAHRKIVLCCRMPVNAVRRYRANVPPPGNAVPSSRPKVLETEGSERKKVDSPPTKAFKGRPLPKSRML